MTDSPDLESPSVRPLDREALTGLIGSLPDAVFIVDTSGRIVLANPLASEWFGYPVEVLVGSPVELLVPMRHRPAHVEQRAKYVAAPIARRMASGARLRAVRRDGSEFPVDISIAPACLGDERVIICCVRDMTGWRDLEEALRLTESKYRLFVQEGREVFYRVSADDDLLRGRVVFVSNHARALTGFDPQAFIDSPDLWISLLHPDDLGTIAQSTLEAASTGAPVVREYRIKGPQGEFLWVEDRITPIVDSAGRCVGYHGVARDVSDRKHAQLAFASAQERLHLALSAGQIGLWDWDVSSQVVVYSPEWCRIAGMEAREMREDISVWRERLHEHDAPVVLGELHRALDGDGTRLTLRYRLRQSTDQWRHVLGTLLVVRGERGDVRRVLGAEVDITEHAELYQQFVHLQRVEGLAVFAGSIVHDVNNVLLVTTGAAESARHALSRENYEDVDSSLALIQRTGRQLEELGRELMKYARRETPDELTQLVDVAVVAADLLPTLQRLAGRRVRLELADAVGDTRVIGVRAQIQQVLMNLVANARDAMPSGGTVRVRVEGQAAQPGRAEATVLLEVADTGTGMPPEVRERIFDPFFTTKAAGSGTGLGLAAVRAIAGRHHASIDVDSREGAGTAFRLRFPAAPVSGSAV